ncbi:RagB/SusD family nutrient uptake outer membrane protein [Flavobacteriaceae bacterium F08102]|nr:RagB/SusD family nutrient uptake outer membrane protein [Flavobacteriaceae bacterium F08102]
MKNIIKSQFKLWSLTLCLIIMTVSCNEEYLDIPLPSNALAAEGAFSSIGAIDQMMSQLHFDFADKVVARYSMNRQFEPYSDNGYNARNLDLYLTNNLTPIDEGLYSWSALYRAIFTANFLLEGLPEADAPELDEPTRNEHIAAASVVRAYAYYQLVRLYGDVPLIISTNAKENQFLPRSPKAEVYTLIENDLLNAIAKAPANPGEAYFINSKYIPQAILADVYLTQEKWSEAEAMADAVISSGHYVLDTQIENVFLRSSTATIMATGYSSVFSEAEKNLAYPGADQCPANLNPFFRIFFEDRMFALSESLLNSFEPGDLRKEKWVAFSNFNNYPDPSERYFAEKYKFFGYYRASDPAPGKEEDNKFIRLAEVILIRAEARAHLNDLEGAADDLDAIRNRANLDDTTASTQAELIEAILHERRVELFFENGKRWYDLVRTGTADAVLKVLPYKTGWTADKVLMPIPKDEIDKSGNVLTQNPGY